VGVLLLLLPAGRPTVGISLAPSKTPTVKQQQAAAAARKQQPGSSGLQSQHSIDDALHDLNALHLSPRSAAAAAAAAAAATAASVASDASVHGSVTSMSEAASEVSGGAAAAAAAARNKVSWKPLADYSMEADLHRCVVKMLLAQRRIGGLSFVAVHADIAHLWRVECCIHCVGCAVLPG
jgi:hypothetical protein